MLATDCGLRTADADCGLQSVACRLWAVGCGMRAADYRMWASGWFFVPGADCLLLDIEHWLLVAGCWLLAAGRWPLVAGR